jgi:hypothetical protein
VSRTLAASTPSVVYTAAEQTIDFGTPQAACTVRVYQLATGYGRGSPRTASV